MTDTEATEVWRLATQAIVHLHRAQYSTAVVSALVQLGRLQEVARVAGADIAAAKASVNYEVST